MTRKYYLILFIISILVRGGLGWLQKSPGFMDAEYYFIGGQALARGEGFNEQILWNYLDDPAGLPHPSHGYWMPLASILAAAGMFITQSQGFAASQWVFILISSLVPLLTAYLGFQLTQSRRSALLAGGIAIFAAFYLPVMNTSDTFGLYAVLGAAFFILLSRPSKNSAYTLPILLGMIAGLMHLGRADGILWLGFAWIGAIFAPLSKMEKFSFRGITQKSLLILGGYLIVMGPWFARNLRVFGSLLAPGNSRSLWITTYNELFIYPASQLTFEHWLASGFSAIIKARTWALGINLQRSLAEQGIIFLAPFILLGLWGMRKDFRIRLAGFIWLCTFLVMTVVFPLQGARGGFFHSSAALLPILWALAPVGLNNALAWAGSVRGWNIREASQIFSGAVLFFTILLSVFAVGSKMLGEENGVSPWEQNQITYQKLEETLTGFGALPADVVLTIDSPGYYAYTQRRALAIPDGEVQVSLDVAKKFGGDFLLLESDHPEGLNDLYEHPETPFGLEYLTTIDGTHIFRIK